MVYHVTASGIDGCGKSTAFKQLSQRLSNEYQCNVVQVGRSAWVDRPNQERQYFGDSINESFDALHFWADRKDLRTLSGIINLLYAPVNKGMKTYSKAVYKPDFLLSCRDTILDPIVYSSYYFPFTQDWPLKARAEMLPLFGSGKHSDLVFYMDLDSETAYKRIMERMETEARLDGDSNQQIDRRKYHDLHETPENLAFLRAQFEEIVPFAKEEVGLDIVQIDATEPKEQVVENMMAHIHDKFFDSAHSAQID